MATVVRYFSTVSAGAGDGTSWANRAELLSSGVWSTIITGWNYAGTDNLLCYIGPGSYPALALSGISPTNVTKLILHGCDSSGNPLTPANPNWISPQPNYDVSAYPWFTRFGANTNTIITVGANLHFLGFEATSQNNTGIVQNYYLADWCYFKTAGTGGTAGIAVAPNTAGTTQNCIIENDLNNWSAAFNTNSSRVINCRFVNLKGVSNAGPRHGITSQNTNNTALIIGCTVVGFVDATGILSTAGTTGTGQYTIYGNTVVNCLKGVDFISTSHHNTYRVYVSNNYIANMLDVGVSMAFDHNLVFSNRFRDNVNGHLAGSYTDFDNYTVDSDDATEFVNAAGGDYRIKYGSSVWGKKYGAGDEIPTGGGTTYYPSISSWID